MTNVVCRDDGKKPTRELFVDFRCRLLSRKVIPSISNTGRYNEIEFVGDDAFMAHQHVNTSLRQEYQCNDFHRK